MQTLIRLVKFDTIDTRLNANNSLNFTALEPEVGPSCCGLDGRCCSLFHYCTLHLLQRQKAVPEWQSIYSIPNLWLYAAWQLH